MAVRSAPNAFPPVKVTYFRRAKPHRVYAVTVGLGDKAKPVGTIKNVTIRLLGAGAQIVPSEQTLDVTRPDLKATFFVTPLATGWLRAQRLEILIQGRKVQEVPMATRVVTQRWAAFWLALALMAPTLLLAWQSAEASWLADTIAAHVPELPAALTKNAPAVGAGWDSFWRGLGDAGARVNASLHERALAFPVFIGCLLMSLWSLFIHRQRRTSRWSQPIALPTAATDE